MVNLARIEIIGSRRMALEDAYAQNSRADQVCRIRFTNWYQTMGAVVSPAAVKQRASTLKAENESLRERRLAKEEQAAQRRN